MPRAPRHRRRAALGVVALLALGGTVSQPAGATERSELEASWMNPPASVPNGGTVQLATRINVNDASGAPGLVDELVATIRLTRGTVTTIPSACVESGPTPSSISEDGRTLVCALGPQAYGTALSVTTTVRADGRDGDRLSASVSSGGSTVELPELPIRATPGINLVFDAAPHSRHVGIGHTDAAHQLPFGISVPVGAETLSDEPIRFDVTITDSAYGVSAIETVRGGVEAGTASSDCSPIDDVSQTASANLPASSLEKTGRQYTTSFSSCTVTRTAPGTFSVEVSGHADVRRAPEVSGAVGHPALPTDALFIGAAAIDLAAFDVFDDDHTVFGYTATASNLTATLPNGRTVTETNLEDNAQKVVIVPSGTVASYIHRASTGVWATEDGSMQEGYGQGSPWDGEVKLTPGFTFVQQIGDSRLRGRTASTLGGLITGQCAVIDSPAVVWNGVAPQNSAVTLPSYSLEYHTARIADPTSFSCGDGSWSSSAPADPSEVTAMRATFAPAEYGDTPLPSQGIAVPLSVAPHVTGGAGIWTYASILDHATGTWTAGAEITDTVLTETAGQAHPGTTGMRDFGSVLASRVQAIKGASVDAIESGDEVTYRIVGTVVSAQTRGGVPSSLDLVDTMPAGATYIDGSASSAPSSVTTDPDGRTTLVWKDHPSEVNIKTEITYRARIVGAEGAYRNTLTVSNAADGLGDLDVPEAEASAVVRVQSAYKTLLDKTVASKEFAIDAGNRWSISLTNVDAVAQFRTDIIDVLPFNGDGRATSFHGEYAIGTIEAPRNSVVFYSAADPRTIAQDPADPTNGAFGRPAGNSVGWSATRPDTVTAIRFIGADLPAGATVVYDIPFTTTGARAGDVYDNIATARATNTRLQMIRSESSTVAAERSRLQIDKMLVSDPAALAPGSSVSWTITGKNAGQDTARDVVITDSVGTGIDPDSIVITDTTLGTASGAHWTIGDLQAGQEATAVVTARLQIDPDLASTIENTAVIESPEHPFAAGSECIPNDGVDADTDQCDVVVTILPESRGASDGPATVLDDGLASTGFDAGPLPLAALAALLLGAAASIVTVIRRRRERHEEIDSSACPPTVP